MPRRFQFSLRALLVGIAVLTTLLAVVSSRAREQRDTVAALEARGWHVEYDWELRSDERPGPAWLRRIVGDDYFQRVVVVLVGRGEEMDARRTEESISLLRKLPNLRAVTFYPMIPEQSQDMLATALPQCRVAPYPFP